MADVQFRVSPRADLIPLRSNPILRRLFSPPVLAVAVAYLAGLWIGRWAILRLAPDAISLRLVGHAVSIGRLHERLLEKGLEVTVLLGGVFFLETLWVGWSKCSLRHLLVRRTASSRTDLICYLAWLTPAMTTLGGILTLGCALLSTSWLRNRLSQATGFAPSVAGAPVLAQVAALFLVYSLFDYWSHRLDHSRWMWPLHRYHHGAEDFTVLNAGRTHPAMFTALVGTTLPAVLLSASPEAVVDLNIFAMTIRLLIHSRIDSDFGWIGRWLVQSPLHHRLHHGLHLRGRPVHLSLVPLWDRLFGTWGGQVAADLPIGVDTPYRHGAWVAPDLWRDYREFWAGLLAGRGR